MVLVHVKSGYRIHKVMGSEMEDFVRSIFIYAAVRYNERVGNMERAVIVSRDLLESIEVA